MTDSCIIYLVPSTMPAKECKPGFKRCQDALGKAGNGLDYPLAPKSLLCCAHKTWPFRS